MLKITKSLIKRLPAQSRASANKPESNQTNIDTNFKDHRAAFKSKTTWEVVRALIVYQICSVPSVVNNNEQIMKFARKICGKRLFAAVMKLSFYGHFVAGENEEKIDPVMKRLQEFGVRPILDYSVEEDLSEQEAQQREKEAMLSLDEEKLDPLRKFQPSYKLVPRRYKVESARTYFYSNESNCEKNMEIFIKCLETVAPYGNGLTAIKLTALGRPQLLLQVSEVINKTRLYIEALVGGSGSVLSHHLTRETLAERFQAEGFQCHEVETFLTRLTQDVSGVIHIFPWRGIMDEDSKLSSTFLVPDMKTKQMVPLIGQISEQEEAMFRNLIRRTRTVIQVANELNVSVMVDAEQTYFQPAISRITLELMYKYNTSRPIVRNTYQCYLKDTLKELSTDLEQAKRQNFYFGAKLVRGAYIEQERERAIEMRYPDPTNESFEATTDMYHEAFTTCLKRMKEEKSNGGDARRVSIMVASHNEDTVRFALESMKDFGIVKEDKCVSFGQLYGMCDYITFPLGQSGYAAYKYMPYGPVLEVLPYLSRRMNENKGILKKVKKEKSLLRKEILRRIATLHFFKKPKGPFRMEN